MDIPALLLVLTVGLLTPGPDFVLVLRGGLEGVRRGQMTVLGIAAGLATQMLVLVLGFGALGMHPEVLEAVRYAGAAVLLWLGLKLVFRRRQNPEAVTQASLESGKTAFLEGLLCNLTNPKAFLFFASLFARTQDADSGTSDRARLAIVIVLHGLVCWSLVNALLQIPRLRALLVRVQEPLLTLFGVMLSLFAILVVLG
jgi:threonine/homoserine/homoserine lactone efflux protein